MRTFTVYSQTMPARHFQAEQISMEGNQVQFYDKSIDGNSRRLVAVHLLAPGECVKETENK
jgi:hypothetical protein